MRQRIKRLQDITAQGTKRLTKEEGEFLAKHNKTAHDIIHNGQSFVEINPSEEYTKTAEGIINKLLPPDKRNTRVIAIRVKHYQED